MLIYVAHKFGGNIANIDKAKKITHDLQIKDLENAYICPLNTFSHLGYNEIGYDQEIDLCLDLLTVCDVLLVTSEPSGGIKREIAFAELVGMEVRYLDDEFRPH